MIKLPVEPLFFEPVYFEKIWGGNTLKNKFNRQISSEKLIGESWELSAFRSAQSIVNSGELQGITLKELTSKASEPLTGSVSLQEFPLLIKFIDASQRLSVQVHPASNSQNAKSECWYVADTKNNAKLITGFSMDLTREIILNSLKSKSLSSILNEVTIKAGEMYYIPSGTVHAIIGDCLIYEVQQSSDTTFRLYDWDRLDKFNNPRDLHVEQALETLDLQGNMSYKIDPVVLEDDGYMHSLRMVCKYFAVEEYSFAKSLEIKPTQRHSFRVVTVIEGSITVRYNHKRKNIEKGKTVLIPYVLKEISVFAEAGSKMLVTFIPDLILDIIEPLIAKKISPEKIASLAGSSKNNVLQPFLIGEALKS